MKTFLSFLLSFFSFASFAITPITGDTSLCVGSISFLSDSTLGGIWSSSDTLIATIDTTDSITGISVGSVTITYTVGDSNVTKMVTINPTPAPITGPANVCIGSTISLNDTSGGGFYDIGDWGFEDYGEVIVSLYGEVTGVSSGFANITYTLSTGCFISTNIFVLPPTPSITGVTSIDVDSTTALHNTMSGGIWSSNNISVATVDSTTGIVTGVAAGTAIITYTNVCSSTIPITVKLPLSISNLSTTNESKIITFPNPANDEIIIQTDNPLHYTITLYNIIGQVINIRQSNEQHQIIDVSRLPSGLYYLNIIDDVGTRTDNKITIVH